MSCGFDDRHKITNLDGLRRCLFLEQEVLKPTHRAVDDMVNVGRLDRVAWRRIVDFDPGSRERNNLTLKLRISIDPCTNVLGCRRIPSRNEFLQHLVESWR